MHLPVGTGRLGSVQVEITLLLLESAGNRYVVSINYR